VKRVFVFDPLAFFYERRRMKARNPPSKQFPLEQALL
jgi:hypothetical protein